MTEPVETWLPQQPQRQDSLTDQLTDLHRVAARLGMYDAADWLWKQALSRTTEDVPPENKRCRSGRGAGSIYGCILPTGHAGNHRWDDERLAPPGWLSTRTTEDGDDG